MIHRLPPAPECDASTPHTHTPYRQEPQLEALEEFEVYMRTQNTLAIAFISASAMLIATGVVLIVRGYGDSGWVALGLLLAAVVVLGGLCFAAISVRRLAPSSEALNRLPALEVDIARRRSDREIETTLRLFLFVSIPLLASSLIAPVAPSIWHYAGWARWPLLTVLIVSAVCIADIVWRKLRKIEAATTTSRVRVARDNATDDAGAILATLDTSTSDSGHSASVDCGTCHH